RKMEVTMAKYQSGVVGFFADDHKLLEAAHATYKAGYRKFDTISPFPIHGMDQAMGLKHSWIPWVTFFGGILGCSIGLGFQWWVNNVSWPINFGGKPGFGVPGFIPITFEMTVLFAAMSTAGALLVACGLPKVDPPIIDPELQSHKFAVWIPETDFNYDTARAESFLKSIGALEVRKVAQY
ncbi:MAG: DUF3341 domain-containing protein, partial [Bdellovibrionales bacterium]|nr:DUF3341 domain-containing protein [Bdellovibrionales bacterium]